MAWGSFLAGYRVASYELCHRKNIATMWDAVVWLLSSPTDRVAMS